MSIQVEEGPIRIDIDDPQFSYRGKRIAIKIRQMMWPVVLGCEQQTDGSWEAGADLTDDLFASDPPGGGDPVQYAIAQHGSAAGFVRAVVVPRLNKWLGDVWPPVAPDDVPADAPLQTIQAALFGIRFVAQADGTVTATL